MVLRKCSVSGHIGSLPSPRVSGSSSHAVPVSITPSTISFTEFAVQVEPLRSRRLMISASDSGLSLGSTHWWNRIRRLSSPLSSSARNASAVSWPPSIWWMPVIPTAF